ncbi:hypothetical protein GCM10010145_46830 [Streptomyces ruber]|uniref:Uncharacterized protein n=2 Tax=Streptomyces TaxID=1883 RepID=A0A918BL75_9ACTN|nr:hypothetical protein [Streptomyces ruber]GGQ71916.1 hypothetical protein GCM10010145_46830 [Streptomyces ruber]
MPPVVMPASWLWPVQVSFVRAVVVVRPPAVSVPSLSYDQGVAEAIRPVSWPASLQVNSALPVASLPVLV